MKTTGLLTVILFLLLINACSNAQENKDVELYANEYGQIELIRKSDTLMRTIIKNNEGDVFDTTVAIRYDFPLIKQTDSLPFLVFKMGGIELKKACLVIHEFSNLQYLAQFIRIKEMYTRPFYKIGKEITFKGDIRFSKGGSTIDGIYFLDTGKIKEGYFKVTGTIKKEKYPLAFYSTDESPQGMFSDTSIAHYRLVIENYTIEEIPKTIYKGTTINIAGRAAFIYEFADSEAFFLHGKESEWEKDELNKEIKIEAVLVQDRFQKSLLKNWEIIKD